MNYRDTKIPIDSIEVDDFECNCPECKEKGCTCWSCDYCGERDCRGCFSDAEIEMINQRIVLKAQQHIISPIVSKPYLVKQKKSVPLNISKPFTYSFEDTLERTDEIIEKDAQELMEKASKEKE